MPRVWDHGLPLDVALFSRFSTWLFRLLPPSVFARRFQNAANARFDHSMNAMRPDHSITTSTVVVNDDLPSRILSGCVQVRPGVARLTSSGVDFTDGTHVDDIDAVVCATGESVQGSDRPGQGGRLGSAVKTDPLKFGAEVRNYIWRLCRTGVIE